MDQEMLRQHLAQAEHHVDQGERHIAQQHELIADIERDGRDTVTARELLATLEQLQATHIAHRDRIRRELGEGAA